MKIVKYIFCALAVFAIASCSNKLGAPKISTDKYAFELEQAAGEIVVNVLSSRDWTVKLMTDGADVSDITVEPSSAKASDEPVEVRIKVGANTELYRTVYVTFMTETASAAVKFTQPGEKDPKMTYRKATNVTDGKAYLIVYGNKAFALIPGKSYGYPAGTEVNDADGLITLPNDESEFTFTAEGDGYNIHQGSTYVYQTGTYDSFNWGDKPSTGGVWKCEPQADGTMKITNMAVNKWIQYDSGYSSFGSYDSEKGELPSLYERE